MSGSHTGGRGRRGGAGSAVVEALARQSVEAAENIKRTCTPSEEEGAFVLLTSPDGSGIVYSLSPFEYREGLHADLEAGHVAIPIDFWQRPLADLVAWDMRATAFARPSFKVELVPAAGKRVLH